MEDKTQIKIIEDLHQSNEYANFMQKIGWNVKQIKNHKLNGNINIFIKKLGFVKICKIQRTKDIPNLSDLNKLLKDERIMMCKFEPEVLDIDSKNLLFNEYKFHQDNSPLLGTKSIRLDIKPDTEAIFKSFKKDCRYSIRKAQFTDSDIKINDLELFYKIWTESAKRKKIWIPSKDDYLKLSSSFENKYFVITIKDRAGAMVLLHNKTAFYYYAGATKVGTQENLPYVVVWEAIKYAKNLGAERWDFEGIFDSRWPNKNWLGFSHFKKSFGGEEVDFPGCFIRWRWPF